MYQDRQGNPLTGANQAAIDHFDQAVRAFNIYRGDPIADLDRAIEAAPEFAMAHLLKAHLYALATEPEAAAEAIALVDHARTLRLGERELSHIGVLDRVLGGDWNAAATAMDLHNMRYPRDLVGLQVGHLMDFYRGNARNLRDRIARALPHWSEAVPGYHAVLGMQAFGLEESGDYARAEDSGRHAIDLEPLDCWAHHAVAHVMEMQGRAQDGIGWMIAREPHWSGDDNFFKVHNWWHRALYHLDLGQIDEVFRLYDGPIRQDLSVVALDMVDASALLWRLELAGHDVGDRWNELARCWDRHADGRLYPFNDWHAAMAYLGAGDDSAMQRLDAALEASGTGGSDTAEWARSIARPLLDGFAAFRNGDYRRCVERLHPVRYIAHRFGGSHAQRDIIDWTLTEAAVRAGWGEVGEALAAERLTLKPYSPVNQGFLRRSRGR
jgi:hypothetical protein